MINNKIRAHTHTTTTNKLFIIRTTCRIHTNSISIYKYTKIVLIIIIIIKWDLKHTSFFRFFLLLFPPGELYTLLKIWYSAKIRYFSLVHGIERKKMHFKQKNLVKFSFSFSFFCCSRKSSIQKIDVHDDDDGSLILSLTFLSLSLSLSLCPDEFNMANSFKDMV